MDFNTGPSGSGDPSPPPQSRPNAPGDGSEFDLSNPGSYVQTVSRIVRDPVGFFRGLRRDGGYLNPLVFALISGLIYAVLSGIISLIAGTYASFGDFLLSIVITLISIVVGTFIAAGVVHLFVMFLIRPNSGFEPTFRVMAYYLGVVLLVNWLSAIPILGILIGILVLVYSIFLATIGIREQHSTSTGRAAAAVIIPTVLLFVLIVIFVVLVLAAIFAGAQSGF